ncbi:hypothetical protein LOK74_06530 [Brevibacillus humidisoli]|uniref:hypothetical protein n=1 Tax=Brevibacillus humidisoli TaxID=2895522 RepID=UPI001E4A6E1F|nr:hypothetical protein [Brevibacillus humidisoli]UFJ42149.1 hypothetical protein LOK74_06530 [Brevibacillus humidisoli]
MANTLKFNLLIGGIAFFITFVTALLANVWLVSLIRAVIAFILFFLIGFPVHWAYQQLFGQAEAEEQEGGAGQHVDLVAADNDELPQPASPESEPSEEFAPLSAPRLEKDKKEDVEPADIANIVRRLTDQ